MTNKNKWLSALKISKQLSAFKTDHGAVYKLMVCGKISGNFSPYSGSENTS